MTKNIYFTESSTHRIDVSAFDGSNRAILISSNLTSPRGLALDPREGYLFITDWGTDWGQEAKVLRSNMDGTNVQILAKDNVGWPNGITIDFVTRKVYWIDAKYHYIARMNYGGNEREMIIEGKQYVSHPFAMTMLKGDLFFTDWLKKAVIRVGKSNSKENFEIIVSNLRKPMDVRVISEERQPTAPNPCTDGYGKKTHKCDQLCVIKAHNQYSCLCRPPFQLMSDGFTCQRMDQFLLFARSWQVRGISTNVSHTRDVMVPLLSLGSAVGLDYYASKDYVYFTDVKYFKIGRYQIDNRNADVEWLIEDDLEKPSGIAVDWLGGNMYWTDTRVNRPSVICVSKLDGSFKKVLINEGLKEPRALVVHPESG